MQMFWFGNEKKAEALGPFSLTPNPLAKEGEENKASPPAPLQGEGSRMLRKWRVKGAQLGGKLWGCVKPFHGFDAMICAK